VRFHEERVITLERETLADPERASVVEWLLADGMGGYAASTALGINTRRQHGLLVVATRPPLGRLVLLSKLEETLWLGAERYDLATSFYESAVHPDGYRWASSFSLDPLPTLTWELPGGQLTRTVARTYGEPGVILLYQYDGRGLAILELNPLLAYRSHDGLQHENAFLRSEIERGADTVFMSPYDACPRLALRLRGAAWHTAAHWYRGFVYPRDRAAGLEFREDLYSPGRFTLPLKPGATAALSCWADAAPAKLAASERVNDERQRLRDLGSEVDGLAGRLRRAADAFLIRRGETGRLIISSYPAATVRGRDAALALPGLCLATNRTRDARAVLTELTRMSQGGLFSERLAEWSGENEQPSVVAGLWWILAVQRVVDATNETGFLKVRLKDVLFSVLDRLAAGTIPGATLRPDGLLAIEGSDRLGLASDRALQVDVTIEIQALWINALLIGADVAGRLGDKARAEPWLAMATRAREAVQREFWSESAGHLADALTPEGPDLTLRPHQLFAIGLPHCLLPADRSLRLLSAVERELLTPVGLRGAALDRANAAEGRAWPFLMGLYFDALIRLKGEEGKRQTREWLKAFAPSLESAGLGFVSECFENGDPARPAGEPAHGLAVAELLRLCVRVAGKPPTPRAPGAARA
jgi:predicted glycogen debranching enzyme